MAVNQGSNYSEQLVSFQLNRQTFGINIKDVQEIIKMVPITYVPKTPEFVKGVINLRGKIIPVVDLYSRLQLKENTEEYSWKIIVVETVETVVGILVEEVSEVLTLSSENIDAGDDLAIGVNSRYIKGIGKRNDDLIIILNLEEVLDIFGLQGELSEKVG